MSWLKKRGALQADANQKANETFSESKTAFFKIKNNLKKPSKTVKEKMSFIEDIFSGKQRSHTSWDLYWQVYVEVKELLLLICKEGHHDFCKDYAILATREKYIFEDALEKAKPLKEPFTGNSTDDNGVLTLSLLSANPKLITETYIDECTFSQNIEKANAAMDALKWNDLTDPASAWNFLETALRYWNTESSYFEKAKASALKTGKNLLHILSDERAWWEIASIKVEKSSKTNPVIFPDSLFKEAFCTVVNAIAAFDSSPIGVTNFTTLPEKVSFELVLNGNELWIFYYVDKRSIQKFCLKRFNEGAVGGSDPFEFVKALMKSPDGGKLEVELGSKSNSIPKMIERIGIPGPFRKLFFGKSRGKSINFRGAKIESKRDETCALLEESLESAHKKMKNPEWFSEETANENL